MHYIGAAGSTYAAGMTMSEDAGLSGSSSGRCIKWYWAMGAEKHTQND